MPYTRYSILLTPLVLTFELLLLFVLLFYFINIQYTIDTGAGRKLEFLLKSHNKAYIILSFTWYFVGSYLKIYQFQRGLSLAYYLEKTFVQLLLFSIILFAVSGLKTSDLLDVNNSVLFILSFAVGINLFRVNMFLFLKWARERGINNRNILFVDQNSETKSFIELFFKRKDIGYKIAGIINGTEVDGLNIKNFNIDDFNRILEKFRVHIIYLSLEGELSPSEISKIKLLAHKKRVHVNFIPSSNMLGYNDLSVSYLDTLPVLKQTSNPLDYIHSRIIKRSFDVLVSGIGLLFLFFTLFPIIAILILIDSGNPIFFKQKRKGMDGNVFNCYKFRTMRKNSDHDRIITRRGDSRITKIGAFLRSSSLDELPQLLNVIKGDMSLVGPRPHMLKQDEEFDEIIEYYSLRHHVKPGITGLAQVSGFRGEINEDKDMDDRVRADIYYINNWTFFLDLIILYKTIVNMIKGDENAI